ncbi:MAG: phosphate ABC transporter substrate-binding protein [Firmicutes bacterium]|nr:phosphate ABC transporter substrate-binding protein [Bacillota bacterium]
MIGLKAGRAGGTGGVAGRRARRAGSARRVALFVGLVFVVLLGVGLAGCAPKRETLVVRGSDTMVNLSAAWAEAFMQACRSVDISVQGGGSSTGFKALIEGTADLANASRPINDSEAKALRDKGKEPVEHIVAYDAVTIIVNPSNAIEHLDMTQLADILTGRVTNWKDVGGPDRAITVYSRESSSGTYAFVKEHVMANADYAASARLMPSTESILQAVAQDQTGIGYVGLGYLTDAVKAVAVAARPGGTPVLPSAEAVGDGSYPVARPLYIYSAGPPSGVAKDFIDFCLSPEGQRLTGEMGFVPVPGR